MNAPDPSPNSLSRLVDLGPVRITAKHLVDGECSLGGDDRPSSLAVVVVK